MIHKNIYKVHFGKTDKVHRDTIIWYITPVTVYLRSLKSFTHRKLSPLFAHAQE